MHIYKVKDSKTSNFYLVVSLRSRRAFNPTRNLDPAGFFNGGFFMEQGFKRVTVEKRFLNYTWNKEHLIKIAIEYIQKNINNINFLGIYYEKN